MILKKEIVQASKGSEIQIWEQGIPRDSDMKVDPKYKIIIKNKIWKKLGPQV